MCEYTTVFYRIISGCRYAELFHQCYWRQIIQSENKAQPFFSLNGSWHHCVCCNCCFILDVDDNHFGLLSALCWNNHKNLSASVCQTDTQIKQNYDNQQEVSCIRTHPVNLVSWSLALSLHLKTTHSYSTCVRRCTVYVRVVEEGGYLPTPHTLLVVPLHYIRSI